MASNDSSRHQSGLLSNMAGLLIASLACIAILTVAVAGVGRGGTVHGVREIVIVSVLVGAFGFVAAAVIILFRAVRDARRFEQQAASEVGELRLKLAAAEAALTIEPETVVAWDAAGVPRLIVAALRGVPRTLNGVLVFRDWLGEDDARRLREGLDRLFQTGEPFVLNAITRSRTNVEIGARPLPGRVVLRIRAPRAGEETPSALPAVGSTDGKEVEGHRALLDSIPSLAWFVDRDGRLTWANAAYCRTVEVGTFEEAVERQTMVLDGRQRARIVEAVRHAGGHVHTERLRLTDRGERRTFEVVAVPMGEELSFFATDVSVQQSAEDELSRLSAAHDRTLDRVATGVSIFGPNQRLAFFNAAYVELWRLEQDWLLSHPREGEVLDRLRERGLLPVEVEADYRSWKSRILAAARGNEGTEDWWHLHDGRTIHVMAEQRPDGGTTYLFDDVTERLSLESRYNELIGVQRETLDNLQEGVAAFATDGRLRVYNPSFARIWQLARGELEIGPHVDGLVKRLAGLYDDHRVWDEIKRSVTDISDARQQIDGTMTRSDGVVLSYACLPLPDGATLVTFLDITDRKRVEMALIERNEALEAADRLKSAFISHVSYELRTPLTNIIGFSELLASPRVGALNDKQREYLGDIHASSNALQTIINDILDLATIDAGTFDLKLAAVQPRAVIDAALAAVQDRLARAKMNLSVELDPAAPSFIADGNRVAHVLYNLLSNAIGFSEVGQSITVRCMTAGDRIVFEVADRGCGIADEHLDSVFERFESRRRRGKHRGAGLGLAIVKSLVELHGGQVELTSKVGVGTTVRVSLPIAGPQRDEDEQTAAPVSAA
ncbi:MAG: PAS domain-containing protein [Rhizobiales bacterium]|nr:PAS domain-containing protein [Hyphomicrobiales bacterium]